MLIANSNLALRSQGSDSAALKTSLTCLIVAAVLVCGLAGCGNDIPELGKVTGTVSMAGKPLNGVEVVFSPDPSSGEAEKASRGISDESGKYTLVYYTPDGTRVEGAAVGQHFVTLFDNLCIESRDEPVPYRFSVDLSSNLKTPFKEPVVAGDQQIDFDLTNHQNR